MVADCGANCARWLLCLANFIFICVSTGVLIVGTWLAADKASFVNLTLNVTTSKDSPVSPFVGENAEKILKEFVEPAVIEQAAYILIAAGAFILIISFLGYCGAIKESRVLLTAYGIFLIIIFALQIALILLCTLYKSQADHHSKGFLKSTLSKYYTTGDNKDAVTLSWDLIMAQMSCCGVDGYEDFRTARLFVEKSSEEGLGRQVPESCCILTGDPLLLNPADPSCIISPTQSNSYLSTGCYTKFSFMVTENLDLVIGAVVVVAATQLLAIIFAFCLCRAVGQERDYYYKY
eukprot:GFUD01098813.1.p1 GENE.GFUD01098813.1~~GFUD01098813.1.p1  ORF type:complete len:292 (+),score=99.27 GFUD01098813.1:117-992(+)